MENKNLFVKYEINLPKTHTKYIRQFAIDNKCTQRHVLRLILKSWVEKKLMPRYPELATQESIVDELEAMLE